MEIYNKEIKVSNLKFDTLRKIEFGSDIPIRFVVTNNTYDKCHCEIDLLKDYDGNKKIDIFEFNKRRTENIDKFTAVLIIPTGIDAEIGGHCGDGNVIARLIGSACDTLITHPNVVNASDINEMLDNTLYVEGSIITRLLMGQIGLQKVRSNKILMLMDKHDDKLFNNEIINAVSSARVTLGINCDVYEMKNIIKSTSLYSSAERATGKIEYLERLFKIIEKYKNKYDAFVLSTLIDVDTQLQNDYYHYDDIVNPWGGIEAMLTHSIAEVFGIPCAHAPMITSREMMNIELGIVSPRKAPETSSVTYSHCLYKGLHRSPRIVEYDDGLNAKDISCLIIPEKCIGLPVLAAAEQNIPIIIVEENENKMQNDLTKLNTDNLYFVKSYLEAVGVMNALKIGLDICCIDSASTQTLN